MVTSEIWKPITGYEGLYEVSNFGNVRSLDIYDSMGRFRKGRLRKQQLDGKKNYLTVMLSKKGVTKRVIVHRLVAKEFVGNPLNLPEVNHKDECKTNNNADNLEWCDHTYNNNYGSKLESFKGSKNPQAKLTETDVLEIRKLREQGQTLSSIAKQYNISESRVSTITNRKSWGWVS